MTCLEKRVEFLAKALENLFKQHNDLVEKLQHNQDIIENCIRQQCNDQNFEEIQPQSEIHSKTAYDMLYLPPDDDQCIENEVPIEQLKELKLQNDELNKTHKEDISSIRTEMNDLMVRFILNYNSLVYTR